MLSPTWTPDALSSEFLAFSGPVWRLVETQHFISTLKLVDDLAEQEVLERSSMTASPPCQPHVDTSTTCCPRRSATEPPTRTGRASAAPE